MAVKGVAQISKNVGQWRVKVEKEMTPKVLLSILQSAGVASKLMTPIDTLNLINSQDYSVSGNRGVLFFANGFSKTKFNYAYHLHESTNWSPVKKPNATDHYLSKAFELPEYRADYMETIKNGYKL